MNARRSPTQRRLPPVSLVLLLLAVLVLVSVGDLALGRGFDPGELGAALADPFGRNGRILAELRLPRVLTALLAGAALGVAGHLIQAALENRLASPEMIGVNASAVVGVILGLWTGLVTTDNPVGMVAAALIGGLLGGAVTWWSSRGADTSRAVVAGMMVSAGLGGVSVLYLASGQEAFGNLFRWLVGTTDGRLWSHLAVGAPWILSCIVLATIATGVLLLLQSGQRHAVGLGVSTGLARALVLLAGIGAAAGAVALAGAITFVGLVVPHATRALVGPDPRIGVPVSAVVGAIALAGCDGLAQALNRLASGTDAAARFGVPAGAVAAVIGAAVLILVSRKEHVS